MITELSHKCRVTGRSLPPTVRLLLRLFVVAGTCLPNRCPAMIIFVTISLHYPSFRLERMRTIKRKKLWRCFGRYSNQAPSEWVYGVSAISRLSWFYVWTSWYDRAIANWTISRYLHVHDEFPRRKRTCILYLYDSKVENGRCNAPSASSSPAEWPQVTNKEFTLIYFVFDNWLQGTEFLFWC
jgi:hypothetical protein